MEFGNVATTVVRVVGLIITEVAGNAVRARERQRERVRLRFDLFSTAYELTYSSMK